MALWPSRPIAIVQSEDKAMTLPSCPKMIRLGRLLVDAHRRYDDHPQSFQARHHLDDVRQQITAHRKSCRICMAGAEVRDSILTSYAGQIRRGS